MKRLSLFALTLTLGAAAPLFAQPLGGPPVPQLLGPPVPDVPAPHAGWVRATSRPVPRPVSGAFIASKGQDQMQFLSGKGLTGKFLGFDPKAGLSWSHPDILPAKLTIPADRLSRLDLSMRPVPATAISHNGIVEFANGDRLTGEIIGMEDGKLRLSTWYAGELAVDRSAIGTLTPGIIGGSSLYAGPKDKKSWKETKSGSLGWNFVDGGFESTTSGPVIGRSFTKMPAKARVEFDLEWKVGSPSLYVGFMTDNLTSYSGGNCYSIRLTGSSVYIYRYARVGGGVRSYRLSPSSRPHSFGTGPKKVRVALCHDAAKKIVAVIVNGKLVGQWKDTVAGAAALSNGLNFSSRTSNPMRISRLTVSGWNGNLPGVNPTAAAAGAKEDFVMFMNDDHLTGTLEGITGKNMKFKTASFGEVSIPIEKIGTVHFAREHVVTPPMSANSARASLSSNNRVTGIIKSWSEGTVVLVSPIFGEAKFNASVFRRVDFNLGKSRGASVSPHPAPRRSIGTIPGLPIKQVLPGNNIEINGNVPPEILEKLMELNDRQAIPRKR